MIAHTTAEQFAQVLDAVSIGISWEGEGTDDQWAGAEAIMAILCADGRGALRFIP